MEVSFKNISQVLFEVSGKLQWDELKELYEKELQEFLKTVKVPGFRPGNAPREIVERRYGEEIKSRTVSSKISEILDKETEKRERWLYISKIDKFVWNETDGIISFSLNVEVVPRNKIDIDINKEELIKSLGDIKIEVSDDEIKRHVESKKFQSAVLELSDSTEIKGLDGEVGIFDISIKDISTQRVIRKSSNEIVDISRSEEWLKNAVLGMKKGEKRDIVVDGNKKVSLFLKDVRNRVLPTDEDLAKSLGYDNEKEMFEDIKQKIYEAKKSFVRNQLYLQAIKKIAEKNKIDVPTSLIQKFFSGIVSSDPRTDRNEAQNIAIFEAIEHTILSNIAEDMNIEVSDKEVDDFIKKNLGLGAKVNREDVAQRIRFEKARQKIRELVDF